MKRIVKNEMLDYVTLESYIKDLKNKYPELKIATCGKSHLNKEIYSLVLGEGERTVVYVGGTHGLEWMTSLFLLRFCEDILRGEALLSGYTADELLKSIRLVIIPELNPDGIEIALKGASACGIFKSKNFEICNGDFSSWSANAAGVDINHNFNAGWYDLRDFEEEQGVFGPSPRRYGGTYPESEPETKAITRFLRNADASMLISFHSQGEEIYYEYGKNTPEKSLTVARIFSALSGYTLVKNEGHCQGGGLKDWFVEEMKKPAFTVEVGKGENPLPLTDADDIYSTVLPIMVTGLIL